MITTRKWDIIECYVCVDCLERDYFAPTADLDTGEWIDHHTFAKFPCDLCGQTLAGERIGGAIAQLRS